MNSKLLRQLSIIRLISHRPSRLDLIDDTTLTSLPLPPPMKRKRRRKANSITKELNFIEDTTLVMNNPIDVNLVEDPEICEQYEDDDIDDIDDYDDTKENDGDFIDESYQEGETEDPIVLVEDYIYRNTSDYERLHRKKSLATFKEKLHEDVGIIKSDILPTRTQDVRGNLRSSLVDFENSSSHSGSEFSSTFSRPSVGLVFTLLLNLLNLHRSCLEEFEGVFGKIPGTESLNYCELCDKPLYELSALINKRNEKRETLSYKEFVCWECIESYEIYSREFPNCLLKEQHLAKVTKIFKEIESKYFANEDKKDEEVEGVQSQVKVQEMEIMKPDEIKNDRKFSDPLLQQLRELHGQPNGESFVWLKSIPNLFKLRWRILFPEAAQLQ